MSPYACCALPTWWSWRGGCTRSHSEHGRETPQRRWYFVSRRGRVGRCQVCKSQHPLISSQPYENWNTHGSLSRPVLPFALDLDPRPVAGSSSPSRPEEAIASRTGKQNRADPGSSSLIAGWSSPVARQAHNLKVAGSNPAPATKFPKLPGNMFSQRRWRESSASAGEPAHRPADHNLKVAGSNPAPRFYPALSSFPALVLPS
jgi:hypothetical protein